MGFIQALFLDIGGVLLTNGWDHALRKKTAQAFQVDYDEMESRHQLVVDVYETGKMSFDEYLKKVFFYEHHNFTAQEVKQFIMDEVKPFEEMIHFIKQFKKEHRIKIAVVSNEGRELAIDRIRRFDLTSFVDFFVVSAFVHYRKPDLTIYRMALDIAQVPPSRIAYIDDRPLLIEAGKSMGLHSILHRSVSATASALEMIMHSLETG